MNQGSLISDEERSYLDSIYGKHYEGILMYAGRLTRQQEVAKDITQDVFVKLLTSKKAFDDEEGIKAFLYRTAYNACMDFIRHEKVVRNNESSLAIRWDTTLSAEAQERIVIGQQVWEQVLLRIETLPDDERRIVEESILKGRNNRVVAAILGEKYHRVRYVKQGLIRALQRFLHDKKE
jgi:RNA polymerase sigma-70 factor (ECF subfamily)